MLPRAYQRVSGGEEASGIITLDEELQSPPGELALAQEIHAADDRVRLALQGTIPIRADPGSDALAVIFRAGSQHAVNLRGADQVRQKLVRKHHLSGRFEDPVPVSCATCRPRSALHQRAFLPGKELPGGEEKNATRLLPHGQPAGPGHAGRIGCRVERCGLARVDHGDDPSACRHEKALLCLANLDGCAGLAGEADSQASRSLPCPFVLDRELDDRGRAVVDPVRGICRWFAKRCDIAGLPVDDTIFPGGDHGHGQPAAL